MLIFVNSSNQVESRLPWPEPLHPIFRQIGVVFHHDRHFLSAPFRNRRARVQFDRSVGAFAKRWLEWSAGRRSSEVDARAQRMTLSAH